MKTLLNISQYGFLKVHGSGLLNFEFEWHRIAIGMCGLNEAAQNSNKEMER